MLPIAFVLFIAGFLSSSVAAFRFDWNNITCQGLHGPHCGTYLLKVKGQNDTYIGQSYVVGADVLANDASDAWRRLLHEEYRFLTRLTTVQTLNDTANFYPLVGVTDQKTCNFQSVDDAVVPYINAVTNELSYDSWASTSMNSTAVTGVASQLLNASTYGVQVAVCSPGFITDLLNSPTVNIFNVEDTLPPWCEAIEIEPVCPAYVNYQTR
ncbi:LAME_0A08108g1_1 [Lachancea meyersii CBS 8951]|uniref:LAME_0A08108g1_1 n=1 Tax=Lachancea meyersii CBS 8951 TaxID=1266667 RepID=A0A1G4IR95_9SACH|nr:LAME_0A08108g1_1 [Lachancea meyersii CBS 8951]